MFSLSLGYDGEDNAGKIHHLKRFTRCAGVCTVFLNIKFILLLVHGFNRHALFFQTPTYFQETPQ